MKENKERGRLGFHKNTFYIKLKKKNYITLASYDEYFSIEGCLQVHNFCMFL